MKKLICYALLLFPIILLHAQQSEIIISGRAIEHTGEPFIGISIYQKGANNRTISDMDGNFTLRLPGGKKHTVVVAFIGYRTAEFEVEKTENWEIVFYDNAFNVSRGVSTYAHPKEIPVLSYKLRSETDGQGVMFMKNNQPASYNNQSIWSIKNIKQSGSRFTIEEAKGKYYTAGFKLDYNTSVDISTVGRLPEFQSEYAQG